MIISSIYHNIYWNKFNIFFLNIFLEINIYQDESGYSDYPDSRCYCWNSISSIGSMTSLNRLIFIILKRLNDFIYIHVKWLYNDCWSSNCLARTRTNKNFNDRFEFSKFHSILNSRVLFKQSISSRELELQILKAIITVDPRLSIHNSRIVAILFSFPYFFLFYSKK